jgi:hypothetical protein
MMGNIDTNQFLGYGLLGFGAMWIYKKMQSNAAAKGALAMKYNGLALQSNPYGSIHLGGAHKGAINLGSIHLNNPGYMDKGAIHLGGVVRKGMTNRRNVQYHG